jgi:transposase, IS5 family
MNVLVMNLQRLLELLCLFFVLWWQLLVAVALALSSNRRELSYQPSGA